MKKLTAYSYFVFLFAPVTLLFSAQQDTRIMINNTELTPLHTAWTDTLLQMSEQRRNVICESLKNKLPEAIEGIVLQYANINATKEQNIQARYARFRKNLSTLRNLTLAATIFTIAGAIEFGFAATGDVSVSTNTNALIPAYAVTSLSGATFVYSLTYPILSDFCTPEAGFSARVWNRVHVMLGSTLILGASCTPIVQAHAPQFAFIPLAATGACGIALGSILLIKSNFDLWILYTKRKFSLQEFLTSYRENRQDTQSAVPPRPHRSPSRCCCTIL